MECCRWWKRRTERTLAVDRDAATRIIQACASTKKRFIMVSALTSSDPTHKPDWWSAQGWDKFFKSDYSIQTYHEAKVAANQALMNSDNRWTIIRPGALTDEKPSGTIKAGKIDLEGKVSRGNVAQLIAACLEDELTIGLNIDVLDGPDPIDKAVARIASSQETTL